MEPTVNGNPKLSSDNTVPYGAESSGKSEEESKGLFKPSNNEAEYEALIHGMRMAKALGCTRLMIYGDSNLVVQQTMKACDAIAAFHGETFSITRSPT